MPGVKQGETLMPVGMFRSEEGWVQVDYETGNIPIPRSKYEENKYKPDFDKLRSEAEYFRVRFQGGYNISDHVAAHLRGFLPSVFGTRQIHDVVICVSAIPDLKTKSCHPQHFRMARLLCLFGCGQTLMECNADPAALPPNDVTVVIAVLDADDKFE
jgi:hypothetical protein